MKYHPQQCDDEIFFGNRASTDSPRSLPGWASTRLGAPNADGTRPCFVNKSDIIEAIAEHAEEDKNEDPETRRKIEEAGLSSSLQDMLDLGAPTSHIHYMTLDQVDYALYPLAGKLHSRLAKALLVRYNELTGKERPGYLS